MHTAIHQIVVLASAVLVAALSSPVASCAQQPATRQLNPAESARAVEVLTTWFQCEECEEGELAAVARFGQAVVPSLIAVLNEGLSPANREGLRAALEQRYDQLVAHSRTNPNVKVSGTKAEYVALYLGNRDAQYRIRAAQALGAIGGAQARTGLEAASQKPMREDIQAVVRRSISSMRP